MGDMHDFKPQQSHTNLRLGVVTFVVATAALIVGPDIAASMMDEAMPVPPRQHLISAHQDTDTAAPDIERDVDLPFGVADKDCRDFASQSQAQDFMDQSDGDPHRLDGDNDGVACERLR